jgi:hypothetical protein
MRVKNASGNADVIYFIAAIAASTSLGLPPLLHRQMADDGGVMKHVSSSKG